MVHLVGLSGQTPWSPRGEGWPNCIKSAQIKRSKKSWRVPENLHRISNADRYSGAARTELNHGPQELLNILFQWAVYKGKVCGLTVHVASNISRYLWASGNPESAGGERRGSRGLIQDKSRQGGGGWCTHMGETRKSHLVQLAYKNRIKLNSEY